jgi:hypothetical protein
MLNAAPGLNASVNRTVLPMIECGTCCGSNARDAHRLVKKSATRMATAAVQNTRPFLFVGFMRSVVLRELARIGVHRR